MTMTMTTIACAGFAMPGSGRAPASFVRGPVPTGVTASHDDRALAAAADVTDLRFVTTGATVQGAFPGAPAWSPPS
jgi:hypothetical protein